MDTGSRMSIHIGATVCTEAMSRMRETGRREAVRTQRRARACSPRGRRRERIMSKRH
jgi:hypothetical protein